MSTRETDLSLLACHTDEQLLGTVFLYPLPDKIETAWKKLREEYRGVTGSKGNLPYAGLLTVLRAIGYTGATLHPTSKSDPPKFLATSRPIDRDDLHAAVTLWEQALLQTPDDSFSFGYLSPLADLIAGTAPEPVSLWDHITCDNTAVDAPGWVWTAAGWAIAQRLCAEPWPIDGKTVTFRADLDNSLQVWDNKLLWTNTWAAAYGETESDTSSDLDQDENDGAWKTAVRYATLRLDVVMKSHPGLPHPVAVVHPRVSRLSNTLASTRTAWFAPRDGKGPLLNLSMGGKGQHTHLDHTTRLALDAWTRLHGEHVFPRDTGETDFLGLSNLDLSGPPGKLRALVPFSLSFPIGKGVGMHTRRELARHFGTTLGQPLVRNREVAGRHFGYGRTVIDGRDSVLLDDEHFDQILAASGCQRLRILALYQKQDMRTRMQNLLAYHFNRPDLARTGMPEERVIPITEHVEVLLQPAPDLLAHGNHHDKRAALTRQLAGLNAPENTRVLALCETEYDAKAWARQRRASKKPNSTIPDPYALDAKPHVNQELARHGVLAQFLTFYKPGRRSPLKKDREINTDLARLGRELEGHHRGHMAIADMHRAAGLAHPRLTKALTFGPNGLKEPLVHVGLHLRQQLGKRRGPLTEEPKLMWTLVALIPRAGQWQTLAFLPDEHRTGGTWLDYATANHRFRSKTLPEGRRRDDLLPRLVDRALYELGSHAGAARGYVLYVSGAQARSIWPLLANRHLGKTPDTKGLIDKRPALPGFTLSPEHRPRAVVRVTSASDDLASPALIERLSHVDDEETETAEGKIATGLFQLEDTDRTFILCNLPHQYSGGSRHARAGESYTRWGSTDPAEQAETWYSHTTTEITVVHHPADQVPLTYGLAAARLSDHALHWNHRTQYPAPIHLGIQMDKNHPEYRRTIDLFDSDTDSGL
ncbi:RNaseH domain-containing protein [Streptomyces angustmyceticus]